MTNVYIRGSSAISTLGELAIESSNTYPQQSIETIVTYDGQVSYFSIPKVELKKSLEKQNELLRQQVLSALNVADIPESEYSQTAVFLGSTSLDIGSVEPVEDHLIWLSATDLFSKMLRQTFGFYQLDFTFNTACTASANALIYATRFIRQNTIKHAVVVGCEFFNDLTVNGFSSLDLISRTQVKTFCQSRDGLILGEGVGVVILSREPGNKCYFEVLNGYSSCDDHSLTITEENGKHITEVVSKALSLSNVKKNAIDVIKVHGTATVGNDLAEFNALTDLFEQCPPVLAFKPIIGHSLGACGALELALLNYCMDTRQLLKPDYLEHADDLMLPFVNSISELDQANVILLNHFGFGGNNAAIVIKRVNADG